MSNQDLIRAVENGDLTLSQASEVIARSDAAHAEAMRVHLHGSVVVEYERCDECNAIITIDGECVEDHEHEERIPLEVEFPDLWGPLD